MKLNEELFASLAVTEVTGSPFVKYGEHRRNRFFKISAATRCAEAVCCGTGLLGAAPPPTLSRNSPRRPAGRKLLGQALQLTGRLRPQAASLCWAFQPSMKDGEITGLLF